MRYLRNYTSKAAYEAEKGALTKPFVCYVKVSDTQVMMAYSTETSAISEYTFASSSYPVAPTSAIAGIAVAGSSVVGTI